MQDYYKHPEPPRVQIHIAPWVKYTLAIGCLTLLSLSALTIHTIYTQRQEIARLENERDTLTRRNHTLEISINNIAAEHSRLLEQIQHLQTQAAKTTQLENQIAELEAFIESLRNPTEAQTAHSTPPQDPILQSDTNYSPSSSTLRP